MWGRGWKCRIRRETDINNRHFSSAIIETRKKECYWPGWRPPSCSPSCSRWRLLCVSAQMGTCRAGRTAKGRSGRPCRGRMLARVWSGLWSCWCSWWWLTERCLQLQWETRALADSWVSIPVIIIALYHINRLAFLKLPLHHLSSYGLQWRLSQFVIFFVLHLCLYFELCCHFYFLFDSWIFLWESIKYLSMYSFLLQFLRCVGFF